MAVYLFICLFMSCGLTVSSNMYKIGTAETVFLLEIQKDKHLQTAQTPLESMRIIFPKF